MVIDRLVHGRLDAGDKNLIERTGTSSRRVLRKCDSRIVRYTMFSGRYGQQPQDVVTFAGNGPECATVGRRNRKAPPVHGAFRLCEASQSTTQPRKSVLGLTMQRDCGRGRAMG